MKYVTPFAVGTAIVAAAIAVDVHAETLPPGQVNFGTFAPPENGGEYVEVNLTSNLITMAARLVEKQEPDVAHLLGQLQSVHVNVIGLNDENREELRKRAASLREDLDHKGWERVVLVNKDDKNVGVYLKTHGKDAVEGLVAVVLDGEDKHAVFVNVVGEVRPEQLSLLGERLNIDPLKKLGGVTGKKK